MRTIATALGLAGILVGSMALSSNANAGPNCTCRHSGGEIAEGQTACIKSPNGMTMARCERVLNNTSWKMLEMPCPYSSLPENKEQSISIAQLPLTVKVLDAKRN